MKVPSWTTVALVAVGLAATTGCSDQAQALAERQSAVASAGATVMPFDLDATTHVFTDTGFGGVQKVVADNPADAVTIEQIRLHLAGEAEKFRAGDFSDPQAIHGEAMPGSAVLRQRYADITIELTNIESGATLTYRTGDAAVIAAIHDWFNAQTVDHGKHAEHTQQ